MMPQVASELIWEELLESSWAGVGLSGAAGSSARCWESPGKDRQCSEDCCPSGRQSEERVRIPLQGHGPWRGVVSKPVLFL